MSLALRAALAAALVATAAGAVHAGLPQLAAPAQAALLVFAAALVGWTVLDLDETPTAIAAALALVAAGALTLDGFYAGLGDDFIWLLVGAFVMAAVLQTSGLAERWGLALVRGARHPRALCYRLTGFIIATAFVVPSTSGRAALLLPVFAALAQALPAPRLVRALALLFPSVILLSACVSMLGAGAHLVALDMMDRLGGPAPDFAHWVLLAGPFGVLSSLLATEAVLRLCLSRAERAAPLSLPAAPGVPLTRAQWGIVGVAALALLAWATGTWHGVPPALVALAGALAATCRPLTGVDLRTALRRVEWNLVLFMAATLAMGEALLASGAADGLARQLMQALHIDRLAPPAVLALMALVALLSHLVVTSRTARATVLIPTVALPLAAAGVDAGLLIFTAALGSGFCQTLTVSAKPVAMFAGSEHPHFGPADLLRLSLVLLPLLWALLLAFALWVWPALGLG